MSNAPITTPMRICEILLAQSSKYRTRLLPTIERVEIEGRISSALALLVRPHLFRPPPRRSLWRPRSRPARHAFRTIRLMRGNQVRDLPVSGASDADPPAPARVIPRPRLRVGHIQNVVGIDVNIARTSELAPRCDKRRQARKPERGCCRGRQRTTVLVSRTRAHAAS